MKKAPTLNHYVGTRFMQNEVTRIKKVMARHPGRWENLSHFIRSSTQVFLRELERGQREKPRR